VNVLYEPENESLVTLDEIERKKFLDIYLAKSNKETLARLTRAFVPIIETLNKLDKAYYYSLLKTRLNDNL
jgi:hypothetical protein